LNPGKEGRVSRIKVRLHRRVMVKGLALKKDPGKINVDGLTLAYLKVKFHSHD
jgi:hypothetical protein